jgi:hypothetical protein
LIIALILHKSSSSSKGFVIKSSIPRLKPLILSCFIDLAVRKIIGIVLFSALTLWASEKPSIPGSIMSKIQKSKLPALKPFNPDSPSR